MAVVLVTLAIMGELLPESSAIGTISPMSLAIVAFFLIGIVGINRARRQPGWKVEGETPPPPADEARPVKTTPTKISIGPLASTTKSCGSPTGVKEHQNAYLAALASATTYSIQGATLELRTADGAIAASFSRKR
jgi:hypothetical protein